MIINFESAYKALFSGNDPRRETNDGSSIDCPHCETRGISIDGLDDIALELGSCNEQKCKLEAITDLQARLKLAHGRNVLNISTREKARALAKLIASIDPQMGELLMQLLISNAQVLASQLLERLEDQ